MTVFQPQVLSRDLSVVAEALLTRRKEPFDWPTGREIVLSHLGEGTATLHRVTGIESWLQTSLGGVRLRLHIGHAPERLVFLDPQGVKDAPPAGHRLLTALWSPSLIHL